MASCQNTSKTPAIDMANFDLSVAPDADFYQYATGGWQKNNPLKPEYSRYGSFDVLRDNNEKRINELFSEMTKISAAPGSVEQKISDLYKMGLDSTRLNAEGAAPLKSAVGEILSVGDRGQLTGIVAKLHTTVANPFFGVGVQADLMNSDINALYISQSGLTMGNRDYYLDPENEHIRKGYKEYLGRIFRFAGIPEADVEKAVAGVMNVETKLAEKSWSNVELRNIPAQYNPTAKADFEKTYDAIDWEAYYKAMGIGDFETIIVTTPSAVANANDLLKNAPLEDIRYYLAAQYIDAAAPYLSDDFQQASFDFYGKVMSGQQEARDVGAQRHAVGGCRRDVRRQILPRQGQGAHADAGEEPADGARPAHRGARLDVGRHQGQGAGEAGRLYGEDRLSRQVEGLFDAGDRPLEELLGEHRQCQPLVYGRQYLGTRQARG